MRSDRTTGLLMAGITALLWGFLPIAMKIAADDVPVLTIVWFRFALAFVLLALLVGRKRRSRLSILARPPLLGLIAGVGLTLNYLGFLGGLEQTTPSNAQILIQIAPLMLAVVGVIAFKERLNHKQMVGVLIALTGFVLFSYDQHQAATVPPENLTLGNLLLFGGAVAWVVYAALQKQLTKRGFAPQDLNLLIGVIDIFEK